MLSSLAILMLLPIFLISCTPKTIIRPLADEFKLIKKGDIAPFDGYIMTDDYLLTIGDAKIDNSH